MSHKLIDDARLILTEIEKDGLLKREREILSPQSSMIRTAGENSNQSSQVLNLCANNYLGLADNPKLIETAKSALDSHGFGLASVRFICGTQDLHLDLERKLARFLKVDDTILFSSCFDANTGIFEALLDERDAVISDSLNHASLIDGIRLCKARRLRYANNDMGDLEKQLHTARDARHRLIVTDGVFSMDGVIANLPAICDLGERHDAVVMVDDSHAVGIMGATGAGTPEHHGLQARVSILSGTFGKALGGASGGYIAGPKPIIALLRQRARPYLFSNTLAPAICAATIKALDLVAGGTTLRQRLMHNAKFFREGLSSAGFELTPGEHPIIPVMIGDASKATRLAKALFARGVYVTAFSFPVVPRGLARIRTQMSAAHTEAQLTDAIEAFSHAGHDCGLLH